MTQETNWALQKAKERFALRNPMDIIKALAERLFQYGDTNRIVNVRQAVLHSVFRTDGEWLLRTRGDAWLYRMRFVDNLEMYQLTIGDQKNSREAYAEMAKAEMGATMAESQNKSVVP